MKTNHLWRGSSALADMLYLVKAWRLMTKCKKQFQHLQGHSLASSLLLQAVEVGWRDSGGHSNWPRKEKCRRIETCIGQCLFEVKMRADLKSENSVHRKRLKTLHWLIHGYVRKQWWADAGNCSKVGRWKPRYHTYKWDNWISYMLLCLIHGMKWASTRANSPNFSIV